MDVGGPPRYLRPSWHSPEIFAEQSQVINRVNKELGKETFNNFVPNYKSYATLSQIFGKHISVKNRVLMERKIIHNLTQDKSVEEKIEPVACVTWVIKPTH